MLQRMPPILAAALLLTATVASAQTEIRGVVASIDPVTRTVYLTDGRSVQLGSGSTVIADGETRTLEYVQPGMNLVMVPAPGATTTVTTITRQTQLVPQTVAPTPVVASPVVSATGTIVSVEPFTNTLVLQDGRMLRLGPQSVVWQQVPAGSALQPGTQVIVRDATPVGFMTSSTVPPTGQWMMGTVSRVEPAAQQIVLADGTIVHVSPTSTFRMGSENVAITTLRPGTEIVLLRRVTATPVVVTPPGAVVASGPDRYAGSALPYQSYSDRRVEAADVYIVWSPQTR